MNIMVRVSERFCSARIWFQSLLVGLCSRADGKQVASPVSGLVQQQTPSLALALQAEVFKDQSVLRQAVEQISDMFSSRQETSQTGVKCKDWSYYRIK